MTVSNGTESLVLGNGKLTHRFAPACHHTAGSHECDHYGDKRRLEAAIHLQSILLFYIPTSKLGTYKAVYTIPIIQIRIGLDVA